jgi:hypothetical protein
MAPKTREALGVILKALLPEDNQHIYFQEPSKDGMQYPCIIYHRDRTKTAYANNGPYRHTQRYQVEVISRNPDTDIPDKVAALPLTTVNRFFIANGLNHYVYTIYF